MITFGMYSAWGPRDGRVQSEEDGAPEFALTKPVSTSFKFSICTPSFSHRPLLNNYPLGFGMSGMGLVSVDGNGSTHGAGPLGGTMSQRTIMEWSSWTTLWQCITYLP